jgi:hypothetical protein
MAYFTVQKMAGHVKTFNIQHYEYFGWSCIGPMSFCLQDIYAGKLRGTVEVKYTISFFLWRCDTTRVMTSSCLRFLDHTQQRTTVGRTPLAE